MPRQQFVINGLGGQGVLFITRLIAEAAMSKGFSVLTSETHGMAQRGGTVVSHVKVGDFTSPLIRPGQADGLIALKAETLPLHTHFCQKNAWGVVNHPDPMPDIPLAKIHYVDADHLTMAHQSSGSVNLVMLGLALKVMAGQEHPLLTLDDIKRGLSQRFRHQEDRFEKALKSVKDGYHKGVIVTC